LYCKAITFITVVSQQPKSELGRLIVEVFTSHTMRPTHTHIHTLTHSHTR